MNKKMTNCKVCGAEIAKGATCPHCGAKNKKGCLPGILAAFAIIVILGLIGGGESESADNEVETNGVAQEEVQQAVEDAAPAADVDPETIMATLKAAYGEEFDYFNIEGDETGFTIYIGINGLAADTAVAKAAGYDETYEPWAESRAAIESLYDSTYEFLETYGMKNPSLMICVVNDSNTENILLVVYMGEIVYDVMAE